MFTRPVLSQPDLERVINALDNELDRILSGDGDDAHAPELRSEAAYDVVYERIYKALPNCRHSGSFCQEGY